MKKKFQTIIFYVLFGIIFFFGNISFGFGLSDSIIEYKEIFNINKQEKFFGYNNLIFGKINFFEKDDNFKIGKNGTLQIGLDNFIGKEKTIYQYITDNLNSKTIIKRYVEEVFKKQSNILLNKIENESESLKNCRIYDLQIKRYSDFPLILSYYSYYIELGIGDIENILICYLLRNKENLSIKGEIKTVYGYEREKNIGIGINTIQGLWKYGDEISVYDKVSKGKGYVDGYAIFFKNGKYISEKVEGGGICGVSTVLYQTSLKSYSSFSITERYPHSEFYQLYYNHYGIDASIYGEKGVIYKDLKIKNNHGNILIQTFSKTIGMKQGFQYGVILWSLKPFKKTYFKNMSKNDKKIVTGIYNDKNQLIDSITSYYPGGIH